MASYEQAPDTQSLQFQPYQLPYNQIMQTVGAKTQYWIQGANQLKSAAQSAAGLDLSLDSNRQALNDFSKSANDQVSKAAKSDLSIGDNIDQALNIFKPLYDGTSDLSQNIMGDHAITTRAKQVAQQFEESKTKNGGKDYSPINQQYALDSYNDFVRKGDPKGWKDAYQNLKGYTPYHDYAKEFADAAKNCKGNSTSSVGVNGMYITSSETSEVDANKMAGCLGSNLSPQAEQQIQIEGYVKYGKNYHALADDYAPIAQQNRNTILTNKAQLSASMLDPRYSPEQKVGMQRQLDDYDKQVSNIDSASQSIANGDLSYIKNNYEQLAGAVYRGQKIGAMANAFAYSNTHNDMKADPVQMMLAKFQNDDHLLDKKEAYESQHLKEEFDYKLRLEQGKQAKSLGEITPFIPPVNPDVAQVKKTQGDFQTEVAANQADIKDNDLSLYQHLLTSPITKDIVEGNPTSNPSVFGASKEAILSNPYILQQDPLLAAYKQKADQLKMQENIHASAAAAINSSPAVQAAKNTVAKLVGNINQGEDIRVTPFGGGTQQVLHLSAADRQALLLGNHPSMSLSKNIEGYHGSSMGIGGGSYSQYSVNTIKIGGREYTLPDNSDLVNKIDQRNNLSKDYQSVVDNAYNQHFVNNPTYGDLTSYNGQDKLQVQNSLVGALRGTLTIPEDKDLKVVSTDWNGKVQFTVPANTKGNFPDPSVLQNAAARLGFTSLVPVPGAEGMYEASGVRQFNRQGDVLLAHQIQQVAENLQTVAKQSGQRFPATPIIKDYNGITVTAVPGPDGQLAYQLSNKDQSGSVFYATSPTELISVLSQLTR